MSCRSACRARACRSSRAPWLRRCRPALDAHRAGPGSPSPDLSDLILPLEESPGSWASEAVQTPENTGDLHGRKSSTGKLFAPDERVLTDPQNVIRALVQ